MTLLIANRIKRAVLLRAASSIPPRSAPGRSKNRSLHCVDNAFAWCRGCKRLVKLGETRPTISRISGASMNETQTGFENMNFGLIAQQELTATQWVLRIALWWGNFSVPSFSGGRRCQNKTHCCQMKMHNLNNKSTAHDDEWEWVLCVFWGNEWLSQCDVCEILIQLDYDDVDVEVLAIHVSVCLSVSCWLWATLNGHVGAQCIRSIRLSNNRQGSVQWWTSSGTKWKKKPLSLVEQQLTTTNYATFRVFLLFLLMPTKNTIISCYYFLIERRRSKSFS